MDLEALSREIEHVHGIRLRPEELREAASMVTANGAVLRDLAQRLEFETEPATFLRELDRQAGRP